jgi:predicted small secreted protein
MRTILILSILLASCSKTCHECNTNMGWGYPIEICDDLAKTQVAPDNFVSFYVDPEMYIPMLEQNGYKCVRVN